MKCLPFEIWRDIPGYEELYQVSTMGNIRSLNYRGWGKTHIVCPSTSKRGYLRIVLSKNKDNKTFLIHRLVAITFLGFPTETKPHVNHLDECKTNNSISNLEYCDAGYNDRYGTRTERIQQKRSYRVNQYTMDGKLIKTWASMSEARKAGYSHCGNVCRGERPSCKGYVFKYEKEA